MILRLLSILLLISMSAPISAEVRLSGYFIARSACPAFQSMRKQTNPGNIVTTINQAYDLVAKNKDTATHYQIRVDAKPELRWVAINCGEHVVPFNDSPQPDQPGSDQQPTQSSVEDFILAVSWQPGFCETRPSKPECRSQTKDRFDASSFSLHGLWPQPRSNAYCNVASKIVATDKAGRWNDLPVLDLEATTRADLNQIMPGSQSSLHRHEWFKHGSCYNGVSAEIYYRDSIKLVNKLNTSLVRDLFADNIGEEITSGQIRQAFDQQFGDGAGDKIKLACKNDGNRRLFTEITIALRGDLRQLSLSDAMLAAPDANNPGCNQGIVDPAGLQ